MADEGRRARDLGLLDAVDACKREALEIQVWRLVRAGRDPTLGAPSRSRWCNGNFDVLYTAFERDGAIAEIHALLSLQPVFPSKDSWLAYRVSVRAAQTLRLPDLTILAKLGVNTSRYQEREYSRTQEIADAAFFLGFDGLIAPSARWTCLNLMLFTQRVPQDSIQAIDEAGSLVSWENWRKSVRR